MCQTQRMMIVANPGTEDFDDFAGSDVARVRRLLWPLAITLAAGSALVMMSLPEASAQSAKKATTRPTTTNATTTTRATTTTKKPDDDCGKIDTKKYPPTSKPCDKDKSDGSGTSDNGPAAAVQGDAVLATPGPASPIAGVPVYTG